MRRCIAKIAASSRSSVGRRAACSLSSAGAATPVVPGCVGSTFSGLATAGPRLGQGVRGFAQDPTTKAGLGDGIQALQAGQVPDDVVLNTCN